MKIASRGDFGLQVLEIKENSLYHICKVSLASLANALLKGFAPSSLSTLWSAAWESGNSCSKGKSIEKLENMVYLNTKKSTLWIENNRN
jgi:hypothetical protein